MQIKNLFKRNWFAILYFNFKMLPFRQAVRLPFDFYGKIKFQSLKGKVIINTTVSRGCFQFGFAQSEIFAGAPIIISVDGALILKGKPFCLGSGSLLEIKNGATLEAGDDVLIAPRSKVIVKKHIQMGSHVHTSWEIQIMDSNFHYTRNVQTGEIAPIDKDVIIGNNVWIGNRVTINKGTVLPDHTIVASNSLCNKDYSKAGKQYITLAGMPAKIVAEGNERIFETLEPELIEELISQQN